MYIFYQLSLSFFILLSSFCSKKVNLLLSVFLVFGVSLFSGFRGIDIGADDQTYLMFFQYAEHSKSFLDTLSYSQFEISFTILVYIFTRFFSSEYLFFFISLLCTTLCLSAYKKNTDGYIIIFCCFLMTSYYWIGFHHIRFGIAIGLFLWSFTYLYRGNKKISLLLYFFSLTFHNSLIFFLPFFFFYNVKEKYWFYIILLSISLWYISVFKLIVGGVIDLGILSPSVIDLVNGKYSTPISPFQVGGLKMIIISFILIYNYKRKNENNKFVSLYCYGVSLSILMSDFAIFANRMSAFVMAIEPLVLYLFLNDIIKEQHRKKTIISLFMIVVYFLYGMYLLEIQMVLPDYIKNWI